MSADKNTPPSTIKNKRARFDYEILERVEAGLVLRGSEVKSLRAGRASLAEAYAKFDKNELFLLKVHIGEYKQATHNNHEPLRPRKLLLHKRELRKLAQRINERGLTVVPLRLYFTSRGFAKVELGICRGKKSHDKRQSIAKRDVERDLRRAIKSRGRE